MTAKGVHKKTGSKKGTPPRAAKRGEGKKRNTPAQSSRRPAKKVTRTGARRGKAGAPLTSMFTTPTPIDSIEALTGADPIVNDENGPDARADAKDRPARAAASAPSAEDADERDARKRRRERD